MEKNDAISSLSRAIDEMESKVSLLSKEINQMNEDRKQMLNSYRQCLSIDSEGGGDSVEKNDALLNRIQMLEEANRILSEDLQEWRSAFDEKSKECEQNRDKYLRAQQSTEELRRQLATINREGSARNREEVNNINLQLANERFKEQLGELGHLPFLLEAKQLELQETHTKLKLGEKTINALSRDLESCIVKCELLQRSLEKERAKTSKANQEVNEYRKEIENWKTRYDDLEKENCFLLKSVEKMKFLEDCLDSKTTLTVELNKQIDLMKNDHMKHVARIKERVDAQKRAFQNQISGLEQELMQLRLNLSAAYKDREDMKQRMQCEISKLEQKFNDAQVEIHNLKSHVDILKSSYTNMVEDLDDYESDEETNDFDFDSSDIHIF